MKKALLTAIALTIALAFSATAAPEVKTDKDAAKKKPTAEQKALRTEITTKYDINKDGKLDKEERAKISAEDKERMEKAGLNKKHDKKGKKNK